MKSIIIAACLFFTVNTFAQDEKGQAQSGYTKPAPTPPKFKKSKGEVTWEELKKLELPKKGEKLTPSAEVKKLLNKDVSVKGFMMPLDFSAKKVVEFLLMPYIPSCMHVPPPTANQLVLVKLKKGLKITPSYYPVEVFGKLDVQLNKEFESGYQMTAHKVKEIKE